MNVPLLSIIVPNRGRGRYLDLTLKSILESDDQRFEVILNDNSYPDNSVPSTTIEDSRLHIYTELKVLTMTQNWHSALCKARGTWVSFTGSDDGIIGKNLKLLLDNLETTTNSIVTTHPIYFQYEMLDKESWADIPVEMFSVWNSRISYPKLLSVFFPQFKLDMPVPYNRSVVRKDLLAPLILKTSEIPGISPDDFLGQYLSQICGTGMYLELPVFIHGGSSQSNGFQTAFGAHEVQQDSIDFLASFRPKMGKYVRKFGISCAGALALEHYCLARTLTGHAPVNKFMSKLIVLWILFTCTNEGNHHQIPSRLLKLQYHSRKIHKFLYRCIRRIRLYRYFGLRTPVRNRKKIMSSSASVITISEEILSLMNPEPVTTRSNGN
jgi:glycosyltransferase involved in cell wall biosynthesis